MTWELILGIDAAIIGAMWTLLVAHPSAFFELEHYFSRVVAALTAFAWFFWGGASFQGNNATRSLLGLRPTVDDATFNVVRDQTTALTDAAFRCTVGLGILLATSGVFMTIAWALRKHQMADRRDREDR